MGYMKHKYTRTYFLNEDSAGNRTAFGVAGVEDFKRGHFFVPAASLMALPLTRWPWLARRIASMYAYPIVPGALREEERFEYVMPS